MPEMPAALEIERATNLVKGFGWEIKEQKITDSEITLTITKKRQSEIKPGPT